MTSTPATKRRRLDAASATLSKPFVSPFKSPAKRTPSENGTLASTNADIPTERPSTASPSNPTDTPLTATTTTTSALPTSNLNPNPNPNPPLPYTPTTLDTTLAPLQKTHRALSARLRALRTEIDTLAQAVRIETGNADAELVALIAKWKAASREAAEEVFGDVRDRVNRMGGVGAWRAEGRRREEWSGFGGNEGTKGCGGDEEGEGGDDGEREKGRGEVVDEGEDDDTFTMDMMLRGLNVDLDVIGFDKESQRWLD